MAKKKQFVTAAAAFAVAASAVAPAITADAASTTVQLASDYVRGGDLDAALDKEYKGSEIYWYKSSVDMNKLGVFQTAKGFVKGKGIRVEKKLRVLNHAQDIQPEEIVLEEGVPASGLRIQPVLFADGVKYNKVVTYAGFSTEKAGEFEGTFTYSNKAFGVVTKTVKYKVVASKVELSEVKSEVMDDVLSVTADVKNLKDGEKVELVVYANRDMNAALPAVQAEVKDGKLSVKSGKLPAGNHSFILRSGEVKTDVTNFVVEAPMVKEVKAINSTQVELTFNKELDKTIAETEANFKVDNTTLTTAAGTAELQADGKTVVITFVASKNKTSFSLETMNLKTKDLKDVKDFAGTVTVNDTVAPTVVKSEFQTNGDLVITLSEPLAASASPLVRVAGKPVVASSISQFDKVVTVTAAALSSANISVAGGETVSVYVASLTDVAGNEMNIYNGSATKVSDSTKPSITSVTQVGQDRLKVVLSEAIVAINGTNNDDLEVADLKFLKGSSVLDSTAVTLDTDDTSNKTYFVDFDEDQVYGTGVSAVDTVSGTLLLDANAIKDASGNGNAAYSQAFTFNADKTGPAFVSSKVADDKLAFELKFNEAFTGTFGAVDETKIIVTDANGVRYNAVDAETILKSGTTDTLLVDISAGSAAVNELANGTYTIQVLSGAIKDAKLNSNTAFTTTLTVVNGVDTAKPVVSLDASSAVNKFVVNFGKEVTQATALNLSNYKLDGSALPANTVAYFNSTAKDSVTLELPKGSINIGNASTGTDALLNVSGIQSKSGVVADSKNLTVKVGDNTAASITNVQVIGQDVYVTFNEDLVVPATTDADSIFDLKVNNTTVSAGDVSAVAGNKKQVKFTLDATPAGSLVVKVLSTQTTLTDTNGVIVK